MEARRSGHLEEEEKGKQQAVSHVPLGLTLSSCAGHQGQTSSRPIIELELISKLDQRSLLLAGDDEEPGEVVAVDGAVPAVHPHLYPPPAVPRQRLLPVLPADIQRPYLPHSSPPARPPPANLSIDDYQPTLKRMEAAVERAGGGDGDQAVGAARFRVATGGAGGSPAMLDRMEAVVELAGGGDGGRSVGAARFRVGPAGAGTGDVEAERGRPRKGR